MGFFGCGERGGKEGNVGHGTRERRREGRERVWRARARWPPGPPEGSTGVARASLSGRTTPLRPHTHPTHRHDDGLDGDGLLLVDDGRGGEDARDDGDDGAAVGGRAAGEGEQDEEDGGPHDEEVWEGEVARGERLCGRKKGAGVSERWSAGRGSRWRLSPEEGNGRAASQGPPRDAHPTSGAPSFELVTLSGPSRADGGA